MFSWGRKLVAHRQLAAAAVLLLGGCATPTIEQPSAPAKADAASAPAKATATAASTKTNATTLTVPPSTAVVERTPAWIHLDHALRQVDDQNTTHLARAAKARLEEGEPHMAIALLKTKPKSRKKTGELEILHIRALIFAGKPAEALHRLRRSAQRGIHNRDRKWQTLMLELRAQMMLEQYDNALLVAGAISALPLAQSQRSSGYEMFWQRLKSTPATALQELRNNTENLELVRWIYLVELYQRYWFAPHGELAVLKNWRHQHPEHPASRHLLPGRLVADVATQKQPRQIALLLPLSSSYRTEAQAFHDGIMLMHQADTRSGRPSIQIYDTGSDSMPVESTYRQAISDGADFIIGPLGRPAVNRVADYLDPSVKTLLIGNPTKTIPTSANVYQLSMAPEHDGIQLAQRAFKVGHRRALLVSSGSTWGARVQSATMTTWTALGGHIVDQGAVASNSVNKASAIRRLFHIDQSAARVKALERLLGNDQPFKSRLRRRQDIDVIFLFCSRIEAQSINPQIDFHFGHDLPVYSTSHLYHGTPDRINDLDLEGIVVGDMPWILTNSALRNSTRVGHEQHQAYRGSPLDLLFALVMDAYSLSSHITALQSVPGTEHRGFSGLLRVAADGIVQRQLSWARFEDAVPMALPSLH